MQSTENWCIARKRLLITLLVPHTHFCMTTPIASDSPTDPQTPAVPRAVVYDRANRKLRFAHSVDDPQVVLARATLRQGVPVPERSTEAMAAIRAKLDADARRTLENYVPPLPAADVATIRDFVNDAIALALPQTAYTVETLQGPVMRFVHWAVFVVGCELDADLIFDLDLVEVYVRDALPASLVSGTRRNYRAWILRVAEVVNPKKNPQKPIPLNSKGMQEPYTSGEMVALNRWASGQNTEYRRTGAAVLIALGAGAGLTASEIVNLRRSAVTVHDNGAVELNVTVGSEQKRRIVMLAQFEDVIATQAVLLPADGFVFAPHRGRVQNDMVSAFVGRTLRPAGSVTVTSRRLRNTWLVTQLTNRVDVVTLMHAAGLQSLETISRLAQFVPSPTVAECDAQLRGAL